ncbi:MAG: chorismate mutase [Candidatus Gastranaerophilaceae bacterium]
MITKGIRGAITVESNTSKVIEEATLELLEELISQNKIEKDLISYVIFTLTEDLNANFPAKFAREKLAWDEVAMMCFHELDVPNSLKMCLRVLIVINCEQSFIPKFVYLKGAKTLRA